MPPAVDWQRRCRRCNRKEARRTFLVAASRQPPCSECAGLGRRRLALPAAVEASDEGLVSLVGLGRRLARGEFKDVVVCVGGSLLVGGAFEFEREARQSVSCCLLALLERKGLLRRVYSESAAALLHRAGVSAAKVVEVRGPGDRGGEKLCSSAAFLEALAGDFPRDSAKDRCDLMLVLGSSLQEAPFCAVPNLATRSVARALVTRNPFACMSNPFSADIGTMTGKGRHSQFSVSHGCSLRVGKRRVTLRPQWGAHFVGRGSSKYREQWVFDEAPDDWSRRLAVSAGWALELEGLVTQGG